MRSHGYAIVILTLLIAKPLLARDHAPLIIRGTSASNAKPMRLPNRMMAAMKRFGWQFLQDGQQAPDFALKDVAGEEVRLGSTQGSWVLLNFFATWCGPCMREMPALQALSSVSACLDVIGVATGNSEHPGRIAAQQGLGFPLLWDSDGAVGRTWGVHGFPTTYLLDPHGYVQAMAVGGRPWEQMATDVPGLPGCDSRRRR